jgi:hypothetical protein
MKTGLTVLFKEFNRFHQIVSRLKQVSVIAAVSMSLASVFTTAAVAQPVTNYFGLEMPTIYIQAGLVDNPVGEDGLPGPGEHSFPLDLGAFWDPNMQPPVPTPPVLIDRGPGAGVEFRGASAHVFAPHAGESDEGPTWSYDISVGDPPGGFGAVETRVRASLSHGHPDHYMAVVGVLNGTMPGPSVAPRRVIIGGSIGRHTRPYPAIPNKEPIYGGGSMKPRSGMPSPGNLDFPMGELLTIVDTEDTANPYFSMMAIVDGLQGNLINNVFLRQGQNGPILMNLSPMVHMQHLGEFDSLLTIEEATLPQSVVQTIAAGNAYVSVGFSTSIHPDGAIVGAVSMVPGSPMPGSLAGDYNKNNVVDAGDYALWRKTLGQVGHGLAADGNGNDQVDLADGAVWRSNFGKSANLGAAMGSLSNAVSVPEPAGALLLAFGAALGSVRRRRIA